MLIEGVKVGKYDPTLDGKYDRYTGLCFSAKLASDPPLSPDAEETLMPAVTSSQSTVVFHSTLLRGRQSAEVFQKHRHTPLIPNPDLNEIPFSLSDFVTAEEYDRERSVPVRKRFTEAFAADTLLEKRKNIIERAKRVNALLTSLDEPAVTLISHSFFMKVLEATLNGEDLDEEPELLKNRIKPEESTYHFGGGFVFDIRQKRQL